MSNALNNIARNDDRRTNHQLEVVALEIGRDMAAAEVAIDEAIALAAKLMARVPEARLKAELSAVVGQHVFNHIGETISSLTASRGELVKVHRLLETLRREFHLPEVSYGDKPPSPPRPGIQLRAVGG